MKHPFSKLIPPPSHRLDPERIRHVRVVIIAFSILWLIVAIFLVSAWAQISAWLKWPLLAILSLVAPDILSVRKVIQGDVEGWMREVEERRGKN